MTPKSSVADINQLIGDAKNAELCRDINTLRYILEAVWNDYEHLPSFEEYSPLVRAELFRLCGFFLTFYGRAQNKIEYQSKAKNLITCALEIFDEEKSTIGAAESRIALAFCYWNSGEVAEAIFVIDLIIAEFVNTHHPVYLRAQINRLLILGWESKFDEASNLIDKIRVDAEFCDDFRSKAMFFTEAAIIYLAVKEYEKAEIHYHEAIRLSVKIKNERFIAVNFNNLALFYREKSDFKSGHLYAEKALKLYSKLGDKGWIPHVLDTIALIFIDEKKYAEALKTISIAIEVFYKNEDTNGLLDTLWTKTKCFLAVSEIAEALSVFGELQHIALSRVGTIAAHKYSKLLSNEIYVMKKIPLLDEVDEFKKNVVASALIRTNNKIVEAAKVLKLPKHQTLSQILKKQFPTLQDELGFNKRAQRTVKNVKTIQETPRPDNTKVITLDEDNIRQESPIKRIILPDKKYSFEFPFRSPTFELYYFKKSQMKIFGEEKGSVIAVSPIKDLKAGMTVLIGTDDSFYVGKVNLDTVLGLFYINDKNGFSIPIDEKNLIGEPSGFCAVEKTAEEYISFRKLQTV